MNGGASAGDFNAGGMWVACLRLFHLDGDSPGRVRRRILALSLVTWLPLVLLSALSGTLLPSSKVSLPFLYDLEAHVRFLVLLPLLLFAEVGMNDRLPVIINEFTERHLIPEESTAQFVGALASFRRLRAAWFPEIVALALVYGIGVLFWQRVWAIHVTTWYATPQGGYAAHTPAGIFYAYFSMPLVQFLLVRWYWQLVVWAMLMWKVSRIKLRLLATHPDRSGGIAFLSNVGYAFTILAVAHGVMVSAYIANRILFAGAKLQHYTESIALLLVWVLVVIYGPLVVFVGPLLAEKRRGLRLYGDLGERYVRGFDEKWIDGRRPPDEQLLGTSDIQSLADLSNSYHVVETMRYVPISRDAVFRLGIATLAPLAPLMLSVISLAELLKTAVGLVF